MRVKDKKTKGNERSELIKADALLSTLESKTPAEIQAWVDSNVKSVKDVKDILVKILLVIRSME